jgi:Fur family ferric uptake transcriptional regulator
METENIFQNQDLQTTSTGERLLRALIEAGYSNTYPRRVVIQAIASAGGCFSPFEILERGRSWHARLGLTTVYRTLDLLTSLGLVHKVHHEEEGCHSYALADKAHEQRIVCERCHRAEVFEGHDLQALLEAIGQEMGYHIKGHRLEVFGVCPNCQK